MLRLILLLLIITSLSLGVAWIADEPGRVVIDWSDYHIETSLMVLLAGVSLMALVCVIVYYIAYVLIATPRNWLRSRLAKRQSLGLEALTGAFAAIATQDVRTARKQIKRAQHYLPHQPLTLMLASQVARLEGNESQSRLYLEQMLKSEGTEFMALRGLIENARRGGDDANALIHAEKALALKPSDNWVTLTLVGIYARQRRAQEALDLIDRAARKRVVNNAQRRSLTAGVLYEYAKPLAQQHRFELALPSLADALRYQPDFIPASALLAEIYAGQGEINAALKIISRAWKASPHPELTHALLQCYGPEKTHTKVIRTAEKLARMHPGNRESRMLLAALALKRGEVDEARSEVRHLIEERETVRACSAMAEVENAAGNSLEASRWLKRAPMALSDPGYACESCRQPADHWTLSCPQCGSVDSIAWR